jgi:CHAD domain-containing protein
MAGSSMLEVESKFDVDAHLCAPDLTRLRGVGSVDAPSEINLEATYFDTSDLKLLALGITLRHRRGGQDAGWHLKLPDERGRHELREPGSLDDGVPPRFRLILTGIVRDALLVEVATIDTQRSVMRLRDTSDQVVAEFCDDRVSASGPAPLAHASWREWELELVRGDASVGADGTRLLLDAGASPSRSGSKLGHALQGEPKDVMPTGAGRCPAATARDVLAEFLEAQCRRLVQLDPQVRAGLPDAIHQVRVTSRRVRAVLACFVRDFRGDGPRWVRRELGWLVSRLGLARDLEVLRERVRLVISQDSESMAGGASWIDADLSRSIDQARDVVADVLVSERYADLLDALEQPDTWLTWSKRAERPAGKELRSGLRHAWHQLRREAATAEELSGAEGDAALHVVRKSARRLRYATEAASPAFRRGADGLLQAMRDLQQVLGRHHDAVVTEQSLRALAQKHTGPGHAAAVDRMVQVLRREESVDERSYRDLEERVERSGPISGLR